MMSWTLELMRKHTQFIRFCVVGATGVLVNLLAIWLALHAMRSRPSEASLTQTNVAAVLGWLVSVASNFALNDRWTFSRSAQTYDHAWPARLARYYASAASGLGLQLAVLNVLLWLSAALTWSPGLLTLRFYAANLCGIGAGTVVNYLLSKRFVFRRRD